MPPRHLLIDHSLSIRISAKRRIFWPNLFWTLFVSNVVYVCCRVVLVCGRILYMSVCVAEFCSCSCLWQSMRPCLWQNTVCVLVCGRIQYVSLLVAEYSMCPCLWQKILTCRLVAHAVGFNWWKSRLTVPLRNSCLTVPLRNSCFPASWDLCN